MSEPSLDRYEIWAEKENGEEIVIGWSPDPDGGVIVRFIRKCEELGGPYHHPRIVDLWPKELQ